MKCHTPIIFAFTAMLSLLFLETLASTLIKSNGDLVMRKISTKRSPPIGIKKTRSAEIGLQAVVSVIDCFHKNTSNINVFFNSSFAVGASGVQVIEKDGCALLFCSFDEMFSSAFCGSLAVDFATTVSDIIFVVVSPDEVMAELSASDQIFRRICHRTWKLNKTIDVVVVVDPHHTQMEKNVPEVDKLVNSAMSNIASSQKLDQQGLVRWHVHAPESTRVEDNNILLRYRQNLGGKLDSSRNDVSFHDLLEFLSSTWQNLTKSGESMVPILSKQEQQFLYDMEVLYSDAITRIDKYFQSLRDRVVKGKIVSKFGERSAEMIRLITSDFVDATLGFSLVRERTERIIRIESYFFKIVRNLFLLQLQTLESDIFKSLRSELSRVISTKGMSAISQINSVEGIVERLKDRIMELAGLLELNFDVDVYLRQIKKKLSAFIEEFDDSPDGRLELLNYQKRTLKSNRDSPVNPASEDMGARRLQSRRRSFRFDLGIVGMLRPPGMGNFQGYINYATGFLGIPINVLLGVDNSADSSEDSDSDERISPILRVQPKINFNIDL